MSIPLVLANDEVTQQESSEANDIYSAYGLRVVCPARYLGRHCDEPDVKGEVDLSVKVVYGPPIDDLSWELILSFDPTAQPSWQRFRRRHDQKLSRSVRYELVDGLVIECRPADKQLIIFLPQFFDDDSVGAFITGIGLVCYFKTLTRLCLHAAVLEREGRSVVFCGRSGIGKSTLACALSSEGWQVVAEDLAVVEPTDDGFVVRPGYGRIRLWADSVNGLNVIGSASPIIEGSTKFYIPYKSGGSNLRRINGVVFLNERSDTLSSAYELTACTRVPMNATALYRNALASYLCTRPEAAGLFSTCCALASQVPCYQLTLQNGLFSFGQLSRTLSSLFETLD